MDIRSRSGVLLFSVKDGWEGLCLDESILTNADFSNRSLNSVSFDDADLSAATFEGSQLYWPSYFGANLTGADFTGAEIAGGDFKQANLHGSNWTNAKFMVDRLGLPCDFCDANLTGINFSGAQVERALVNDKTRFDASVDPLSLGFIFKVYR